MLNRLEGIVREPPPHRTLTAGGVAHIYENTMPFLSEIYGFSDRMIWVE